MEFDLESFMSEVTAALQPVQPLPSRSTSPPIGGRNEDDEAPPRNEVDIARQGSQATLSKRRRLSPHNHTREKAKVTEGQPPVREEFVTFDSASEIGDNIPDYFYPSLDMTTALVSSHPSIAPRKVSSLEIQSNPSFDLAPAEPLDLMPAFYTYSVKSCLLPIRRVQHALITHYFEYIHPMFPVVDEHHFTKLHQSFNDREELMKKSDFIVYYAIMVAGFAHLSEAEVQKTPYRSVIEGQEAQVDQLKARYWSQQTNDPLVLTQVCLLLSLWSPGWIGFQNNSYWVDMAFKHATSARLSELTSNDSANRRGRVLWWCCVVRDRVLALGMRRPHRLHKTPNEDAVVSEDDFGLEAKFPHHSDIRVKRVNMLAFVWLCKLSRIMEGLAIIQRRAKFARDWGGDKTTNVTPELKELKNLHQELKSSGEEFEADLLEIVGVGDKGVPISVSTLRIISNSLLATLYQPYLALAEDHPALVETGIDPLKLIKEGAREVANSVRVVMTEKKGDAIPTWLASWITLPVAVYHVNQQIRKDSTPDKVLMPFLAQLVRRTSGALLLLLVVRGTTKDHIGEVTDRDKPSALSTTQPTHSGFTFVHSGLTHASVQRDKEAKLLAYVTKAIDSALELNGTSHQRALSTA